MVSLWYPSLNAEVPSFGEYLYDTFKTYIYKTYTSKMTELYRYAEVNFMQFIKLIE